MKSRPSFADLIAFNVDVVGQAQWLTEVYGARRATFAMHIGPHLRHIIEHYEALLDRAADGLVDYDHRMRDAQLEACPQASRTRLDAIVDKLHALATRSPTEPLSVGFVVGVVGNEFYLSPSTLARELNFVASHAIHHYAIIRPLIAAAGVELPRHFGKAPETVRHERLQWAT